MNKRSMSILLCGEIEYDSRVKRFSSFFSNFCDVELSYLIRERLLNDNKNIHPKVSRNEIKLITDYLPRGGRWGYFKFLEYFIRAFVKSIKSDIVYCNDIETLPVGYLLKIIFKKKFLVYDTHELAPYKGTPSKQKIRFRSLIEKKLIKKADLVITVSPRIAKWYRRFYELKKVVSIENAPDLKIEQKNVPYKSDKIRIVWVGIFSAGRGIEEILENGNSFSHSNDIEIHFFGWGELQPKIKKASKKYSCFKLHGPIKQELLIKEISNFDAGLFTYQPSSKNYDWAFPNKIFEYSAANLPIISTPLSESKSIIKKYNIGLVMEGYDHLSALNTINTFKSLSNERLEDFQLGIEAFNKDFGWEEQKNKLQKEIFKV